ncbi:MAG: flavodoxin-dependent (E)-4-hydroxy-3-methylbut-2-enyl-diphosphate synthase [Endomicrobium sp.]|jgi:(E)-4-hydroxy-3-methylbut-2-enyl-diphosphate synthase|nr:flavodoxin-dependent (E)-4-hydroxy-3-methylbut-2-enyl-diphosphate synthase [Endomicrobium sp.]
MKFYKRFQTKKINIGNVTIGGGLPIRIQSMTNTNSRDLKSTVKQIKQLEEVGCELIRVSFPDMESALNVRKIKKHIKIPLIADVHFDYKIALEVIKQGVDKLRINPSNIGSQDKLVALVKEAKNAHIPIRIGINAGSLKKIHHSSNNFMRAKTLVCVAIEHIKVLEKYNFQDIVVSLKASNIDTTIQAYRLFASKRTYPLHLGITEAGSIFSGTIKSSIGVGIMLYDGIGDTIRVSLTADPIEEINVAYCILQYMGLRNLGVEVISCPTCSRCEVDLINIVLKLEKKISVIKNLRKLHKPIKVALMGCVVNGPGEAKDADFGIAASGKNIGVLFKNGNIICKISSDKWVNKIISMIEERMIHIQR